MTALRLSRLGLQDRGGNPLGAYDQAEPCINCGQKVLAPELSGLIARVCVGAGVRLQICEAGFRTRGRSRLTSF